MPKVALFEYTHIENQRKCYPIPSNASRDLLLSNDDVTITTMVRHPYTKHEKESLAL